MKVSSSHVLLSTLASTAYAFPRRVFEIAQNDGAFPELSARASSLLERQAGADAATKVFEPVPIFDGEKQLIDVSEGSGHEWQAPGPDDLRGPCPGESMFFNCVKAKANSSQV